jgi:hypothetical protein
MVKEKRIDQTWTPKQKILLFESLNTKTIPKESFIIWAVKIEKRQTRRIKEKERHWIGKRINKSNQWSDLKS